MPVEPNPFDNAHLIAQRVEQTDPIVQYYIVKRDVMSIGKVCAQINHGCMMFMLAWEKFDHQQKCILNPGGADHIKHLLVKRWFNESFRKIVKVGKDKDFENIKKDLMVFSVKDAGLTEVEMGTETVLVTWPMHKSQVPKSLEKLRLLEPHHLVDK